MRYIKSILAITATSLIAVSCTSTKNTTKTTKTPTFKTTSRGLEYMMVTDVPGTRTAVPGDFVELHISTYDHNDSLIFNSRSLNNGEPAKFKLQAPSFNGDLAEGIMMMSVGDSAVFRVLADSIIASGQNLQSWMDTGKKITYMIKVVSLKNDEDLKKEAASQKAVDDKKLLEYFAKNNIKAKKTASGLYYEILEQGTGDNASKGKTVSVNYTGKTMDGNVFDSNIDPQFNHVEPLKFPVGAGRVIKGWDEGLQLLNKGSKAVFYIPSDLAYGAQSPAPAIPPYSILIFNVELLDIQ